MIGCWNDGYFHLGRKSCLLKLKQYISISFFYSFQKFLTHLSFYKNLLASGNPIDLYSCPHDRLFPNFYQYYFVYQIEFPKDEMFPGLQFLVFSIYLGNFWM